MELGGRLPARLPDAPQEAGGRLARRFREISYRFLRQPTGQARGFPPTGPKVDPARPTTNPRSSSRSRSDDWPCDAPTVDHEPRIRLEPLANPTPIEIPASSRAWLCGPKPHPMPFSPRVPRHQLALDARKRSPPQPMGASFPKARARPACLPSNTLTIHAHCHGKFPLRPLSSRRCQIAPSKFPHPQESATSQPRGIRFFSRRAVSRIPGILKPCQPRRAGTSIRMIPLRIVHPLVSRSGSSLGECNEGKNDEQHRDDRERDLHPAQGMLARHLSGVSVHHHLE